MPMPSKGRRIAMTVRLPYDEYREAARQAKAKGWSMSDYVGWCVRQTLRASRPGHYRATVPAERLSELPDEVKVV